MQNQVKTIDVDQIWMEGKENPCSTYIKYTKVEKKYIKPIEENILDISKSRILKKEFNKSFSAYSRRKKIYAIIRYVDLLDNDELNYLMSKEMTEEQFILEVDGIRTKNYSKLVKRTRNKPQDEWEDKAF